MLPIIKASNTSNSIEIIPSSDINFDETSSSKLMNMENFKTKLTNNNFSTSIDNNVSTSHSDTPNKVMQRYQELTCSHYESVTMSDFIKDPSTLFSSQRKYAIDSHYKKHLGKAVVGGMLGSLLAATLFSVDKKDDKSTSATFYHSLGLITALGAVAGAIIGKNIIQQYQINKIAKDYMENTVDKASKTTYANIVDSHKILADILEVDALADLIMEFTLLDPFYELQWVNWLEEWADGLVSCSGKEQAAKEFKQWHANWADKFKELPTTKLWDKKTVPSKDITKENIISQINVISLRVNLSKIQQQFTSSSSSINLGDFTNLSETDDEDNGSYIAPHSARNALMPLL